MIRSSTFAARKNVNLKIIFISRNHTADDVQISCFSRLKNYKKKKRHLLAIKTCDIGYF